MIKKVEFKNKYNQSLKGFVHEPKKYNTAVIFLHGFPAHCNHSSIKLFSKTLCFLGHLILRFNFSGTDTSEGKFENKTFSKEVEDIKYAIDFLSKNYKFKQLVLIGHSGGAIDATLYAHKDKRIDKLILLSGVSNLKKIVNIEFTKKQIKDFKERRYIIYDKSNKWYDQKRLNQSFYNEFFTLNLIKAIKKYKKQLLVVHGNKDQLISVSHAKELYKNANQPKKLIIIRGANHNFSKIWHGLKVVWCIHKFIREG